MGKLDVTILRYLTPEDFRVLTAVSIIFITLYLLVITTAIKIIENSTYFR